MTHVLVYSLSAWAIALVLALPWALALVSGVKVADRIAERRERS